MREIKFRAWSKISKSMCYEDSGIPLKVIGDDRYELMQYTGLKDKNGKEIYDGDIVKHNCGRKSAEVFMDVEKGQWRIKSNNECFYILANISCEIIGNIYENPELLK